VFFAYGLKVHDYVSGEFGADVNSKEPKRSRRSGWRAISVFRIVFLSLVIATIGPAATPSWESTLTKDPPGNFSELRPVHTTYHFGWSGFTAGTGEIHFNKTTDKRFQLEAAGRTIGLVAAWSMPKRCVRPKASRPRLTARKSSSPISASLIPA
jgi:hypothetical protein